MALSRPNALDDRRLSWLRTAPVTQKRFKGLPRSSGDVVLDPFRVGLRRFARRADGDQEIDNQPVAFTRAFCHRRTRLGQKDATIGLGSRQPLALEARDGLLAVGWATPIRRAMSVVRASPLAAVRSAISSV